MEGGINSSKPLVLLTGATGYIGGRLLPRLLKAGQRIRCAARHPENLSSGRGADVEVVEANLLDYQSIETAVANVKVAYYFVHSLGSIDDFEHKERLCAENFVRAAKKANIERIIYLGGLGAGKDLSPHLSSRQEVGRILRESGVKTVEFRASIIIGSGSLSFEMVRALVDRLPVMITPRWVGAKAQPIAIEDVLDYLVAAIDIPLDESVVFEIGGPDVVSYMDIMKEYANQRGLRRYMIPVPVLTPRLSSLWLGLVTPLYARVGRKLVDSIRNDTLIESQGAKDRFSIYPRKLSDAISRALKNEDREFAETRWSDALSSAGEERSWGGVRFGSRIVDSRSAMVECSTEKVFATIKSIGGDNGWYYANWAWSLRGFIDLLIGGVGSRRGRSDPDSLNVGDIVDFWRIEAVEPNKLLRLRAEMKLPGRAWLQFEVEGDKERSLIRQTAIYDPLGILGQLYWYLLYPLHKLVFAGMLKGIVENSVKLNQGEVKRK